MSLARQQPSQLLRKYAAFFAVIFVAQLCGALLVSNVLQLYFSYQEQQLTLVAFSL